MSNAYGKVNADIKPDWLKIKLSTNKTYADVSQIVKLHGLNTICSSGRCPNKTECWGRRTATFMILGDICTRACRFCATLSGRALPINIEEPEMVARSVALMELRYVVVTSVTRDDLADGGANHWAETVRAIRKENPKAKIELLIPDMGGSEELIDVVLDAAPDVVGHNIETVERLTPHVRSRADYKTSLGVLSYIARSGIRAKSGIMVGLGETDEEVRQALKDIHQTGCSIVTLGQYLRPTKAHLSVARYVEPQMFEEYKSYAEGLGFDFVASAPLVRSSYMAEQWIETVK